MTRADPLLSAVVAEDVERICDRISDALGTLSGRRLLVSGGAGFLGYYLVFTIVAWNRRAGSGEATPSGRTVSRRACVAGFASTSRGSVR